MANQYYKNFILWGEVDFHCLICDESFQDVAELDRHIRWEKHRKVLKAQVKSHKFKKEVIYQIGELYYCEVCNYVASSMKMDDMNLHIESEEHKTNKKKPKSDAEVTVTACKRDGEYVTVNDIIVEEKDWNCVTHIENFCLVCGIFIPLRYSYVKEHIKASKHVINLIAAKLVVEKDRFYRQLFNNSFYCLCCKEALPMSVFEGHWTAKEHCEFKNDPIFKTTYANANAARAIEEKKKKIERGLIIMHQKEHYDILEEKETAICKKCQYVVKLDFKTMNDHKKSHDKDGNKPNPVAVVETPENEDSSTEEDTYEVVFCELTDHGQRRRELSKYGKANYIKLNAGGSKGYCSLCSTTISGHLKLFKEHVNGARHKGHLELKGLKKSKTHMVPDENFKPITEVIKNLYFAEDLKLLCINREVCIDVHSFILVYEIDKRFQYNATKCLICDVLYPYSFDFEHYGTEEHKKRFLSAKVLPREGEFVREIRPDVYHCGICNMIYPFWELMEKHLLSKPHIDNKNVNKYKIFEQKTFDETKVKKSRKTPDVLYLQLLSIGIVRSKGVLSSEDFQVTHCCFQSLYAMQAANAGIQNLKIVQTKNAGVQSVDAMQEKNAGVQSANTIQVPDAGSQSIKVVQVTNGSRPSVDDMQVTNADIQSVNAMQVKNASIETGNAMQATTASL